MCFITDQTEAQAARLYKAAFGRTPDDTGLSYWTDALHNGTPLVNVAEAFIASPEFQQCYGSPDDGTLVTRLYQNVLHRDPDASGVAYWRDALASGGTTRAQLLADLSESIENKAQTPDSQTASVARLYYAALDRAPDASGLSFWTTKLASGEASLDDEANALASSGEFSSRHGNLSDSAFVKELYQNVLGRDADPNGLAAWTDALAKGASHGSVLKSFSECSEFQTRFAATIAKDGIPLS